MGVKVSIDAKIIVVGGTGVGKTSLACCFQDGRFVENPSTIGANLFTRVVDVPDTKYRVHMQIWDTAGQERFRAISKIYYRGVSAAIFCYDITSPESYQEHKYWLPDIRTHAPDNALIYVAGTKLDLANSYTDNEGVPYSQCVEDVTDFFTRGASPPTNIPASPPGHRASIMSASGFGMLNSLGSTDLSHNTSSHPSGWPRPASMYNTYPPPPPPTDTSQYADRCFEVSSKTNTGVRDLFDSIARKLVEQRIAELQQKEAPPPVSDPFPTVRPDKRSSWLGFRGSDSDRKHLTGLDGHSSRNSDGSPCC